MKRQQQKKINVLMCCSDLKRVKGGMVTMVNNLLAYEGWEDCRITYIPTHIESNKLIKLMYFGVAYIRIVWALLFGDISLVHLHVSERGSVYRKAAILKLAKCFGKKVILHHHGADFEVFYQGLSAKDREYVVRFLEAADRNLVLSEKVKENFIRKAPDAKYAVMHNAVTVPAANQYDSEANLIVTMGRLGERKGTYDLLKAIKELDGELPEHIKICLCGDGETEKVREVIREYGLEKRISHVGWVAGKEKEEIALHALCHVLPSYREVLPMSILETMALGIPNISTRIASIPEVIGDGVDGLLIEPGDVNALTEALRTLCFHKEVRQEMSVRAYQLMKEEYSVEACSRKMRGIYKEVLHGEH